MSRKFTRLDGGATENLFWLFVCVSVLRLELQRKLNNNNSSLFYVRIEWYRAQEIQAMRE